jgi:hypothetical protein
MGEKNPPRRVRIVSWMGGEHWYIENVQFLRLEEAIAFCMRNSLEYEVVRDPNFIPRHEGD